jgi:hypothetical protein
MAVGSGTNLAWLNQFRRLRVRYEKRADIHEAFLALACALLCWNTLQKDAYTSAAAGLTSFSRSQHLTISRLELGGISVQVDHGPAVSPTKSCKGKLLVD